MFKKLFVLLIWGLTLFHFQILFAQDFQEVDLKGKKAIEQFMDYHFQNDDPILKQLGRQHLFEGASSEFSDPVNSSEIQDQDLIGYGLTDTKKKLRFVFLEFEQPMSQTVYSVYRKGKKQWFLIGEIPSECKYEGPALRFEKCPDLLLVSARNGGGGTNVFEDSWTTYLISEDADSSIDGYSISPVMCYPDEGHRNIWGLLYDVEFRANKIIWYPQKSKFEGCLEVKVQYFRGLDLSKKDNKDVLLFEKDNKYGDYPLTTSIRVVKIN